MTALAAGGADHGAPGPRDTGDGCSPGSYAAFALDPDGNDSEAFYRESVA